MIENLTPKQLEKLNEIIGKGLAGLFVDEDEYSQEPIEEQED